MTTLKPYDYIAWVDFCVSTERAGGEVPGKRTRSILRKLVREAVRESNRRWINTDFGIDECEKMPDVIAKRLVP